VNVDSTDHNTAAEIVHTFTSGPLIRQVLPGRQLRRKTTAAASGSLNPDENAGTLRSDD
jgi:hypothetical protein